MSRANLFWLIPAGFVNSSRRISPGDIGSNLAICLTPMVVLYFNVVCSIILPSKTKSKFSILKTV